MSEFPPPWPDDAPLWRHLHYAACTAPGAPKAADCIAAQLLELAERMVPKERRVEFLPGEDAWNRAKRYERRRLRQWLMNHARIAQELPPLNDLEQP